MFCVIDEMKASSSILIALLSLITGFAIAMVFLPLFVSISKVKTKGEAQSIAIDFQSYASKKNLSYGELALYGGYFQTLAKKFHLTKEFRENGII